MTPTEAVAFVEKMKAAAPHINFEWDTPKAWAAALADIDWDEAHAALLNAIRKTPWITPAVIQDEVRAMRAEKLKHYIVPPPPNPDDVAGYLHALRAAPRAALHAAATSPLSLESGLDPVTKTRREHLRAGSPRMVDPATTKPDTDRRSHTARQALAEARRKCAAASARLRTNSAGLSETEKQAREQAARLRTQPRPPRKGDPKTLSVAEIQTVLKEARRGQS